MEPNFPVQFDTTGVAVIAIMGGLIPTAVFYAISFLHMRVRIIMSILVISVHSRLLKISNLN